MFPYPREDWGVLTNEQFKSYDEPKRFPFPREDCGGANADRWR